MAVNGGLVVAFTETSPSGSQLRARAFNGDSRAPVWNLIDGGGALGLNHDPFSQCLWFSPFAAEGKLYLVSAEQSGGQANSIFVLRGQ